MHTNITYINALPDFLAMQRVSFCWFITHGLTEELTLFSNISDFSQTTEYIVFSEEFTLIKPPYNLGTAKKYNANYRAQLIIPTEMRHHLEKEVHFQTQFPVITIPLMTTYATFIINGCERVIVSQIIRSPGVYFEKNKNQKAPNKFRQKLPNKMFEMFLPHGLANTSTVDFFFRPSELLRTTMNLESLGKNYSNETFLEERNSSILRYGVFGSKKSNSFKSRIIYSLNLDNSCYAPIASNIYCNSFTFNQQFWTYTNFRFYLLIRQSPNDPSKSKLFLLFFKWLTTTFTPTNLKTISTKTIDKDYYIIKFFKYFSYLFKTLRKYTILINNASIISSSHDQTQKLFQSYNNILADSQLAIQFQINSPIGVLIFKKRIKGFSIHTCHFSFLKRNINKTLLNLTKKNLSQWKNLRPTIYFPTNFKYREYFKDDRVWKHRSFLNKKKLHQYLTSKTKLLRYQNDYEIKTDYHEKFFEKELYTATLIPEYGSWIRFNFQRNTKLNRYNYPLKNREDELIIQLDKITQKPIILFLKELGFTDLEIYQNLHFSDFFYFNQPLLINSKHFNQPIPRFDVDAFDNISEFSQIFDPNYYRIGKIGRLRINNRLNLKIHDQIQIITYEDIFAIVDNLILLTVSKTIQDDIDHLKNKRIRSVGELFQTLFRTGFQRLTRTVRNKIISFESDYIFSFSLVNTAIREFFGSSQLSQYLDQTNPLSSLTHRRRVSGLGPGGLNRDHISFSVRDIHPSHYGRICPIETPEGQNVGLIASLTSCARVNKMGFLETPFWRVINGKVLKTGNPVYLTAEIEDLYKIAPADIITNENNYLTKNIISVRYKQDFMNVIPSEVDFISISTIQVVSIAASLIPFFEHDDANRALMGSNMQRQSVPLMFPQKPIVGTGLENQIAIDSGMTLNAQESGIVSLVTANKIVIKSNTNKKTIYNLQKYLRSNQQTCINQRPIVWKGEKIKSGQMITDGPAIINSELALGQNILVAYMPWQGYNFEDAILISERLVYKDLFTSIHIERYKININSSPEIAEQPMKMIPNLTLSEVKHLNDDGIVTVGTFVKPGDILVGKVISNNISEQLPESKLLRAIFGTKSKGVKDNSYRMPHGESGRVIETIIFNRKTRLTYKFEKIHVFIAQIRKIKVGDKIAGRHGNKGIISRILARQDMPFLPDGTPIDILLNPLGVPSRMNVGQLYECLLGLAGDKLNCRFKILPFDEMYGSDISRILINKKLRQASIKKNKSWLFNPYAPGKMVLIDGRTGKEFENPITVGNAYMLKLIHLVDDKMHSRATGPYSLITQQPLRGKAQHGGQRFGEMEVWALEGFGAAFTLREILTIKSDDMQGRNETLNAIVRGKQLPPFGTPESFRVLVQELRSIGLDISTYQIQRFNSLKKYEIETDLMESYNARSKTFLPTSNINDISF